MTEIVEKILFPLSAIAPMEEPYMVSFEHLHRKLVTHNAGKPHEWSREETIRTSFRFYMSRILCTKRDVEVVHTFLVDLVRTKPLLASVNVAVAKPNLTSTERHQVGVAETGRNAVHFPESELMTFWVVSPPAQMEATLALVMSLARNMPDKAPSALRNLMASAYLTAWKRQPGSWWKRRLALLSQTGIIDTHMGCLVTFDPEVAAQIEDADKLPPHGSGM